MIRPTALLLYPFNAPITAPPLARSSRSLGPRMLSVALDPAPKDGPASRI
ncbi:hypothetical protein CLIM01_05625 [Colletotrichum limetticola]|uniref:Uncharacterized protein n=1 Tax=Colletotrichum limetticola TaxID=1209924 RepID=A0ABQ9PZT5_9PEZI|nr:hypothetical protein CLIM01_05625 [Colletotrichum limetticola]